jgi:hypothetical protein
VCLRTVCWFPQARHESNAKKEQLLVKHSSQHSFSPDIGVNSLKEVETNKTEFFQRLFDYRHYQTDLSRLIEYNTRVREMGRDVRQDPVLDPEATERLLHRLTVADPSARKDRAAYRSAVVNSSLDTHEAKFIENKSNSMANKARNKALSEIFDVLLMSVQYFNEHAPQQLQNQIRSLQESRQAAPPAASSSSSSSSSSAAAVPAVPAATTHANPLVVSLDLSSGPELHISDMDIQPAPAPSSSSSSSSSSSDNNHPQASSSVANIATAAVISSSAASDASVASSSVPSVAAPVANVVPIASSATAVTKPDRYVTKKAAAGLLSASSAGNSPLRSSSRGSGDRAASNNPFNPVVRSSSQEQPQSNDDHSSGGETLDIRRSLPNMLANPSISSAMHSVLTMALDSHREHLSRAEFVAMCTHAIDNGLIPPMNFILSSTSRGKKISEHSDVLATRACTSVPTDLPAKKKSEKLVESRHKRRNNGEISIEDSLNECKFSIQY